MKTDTLKSSDELLISKSLALLSSAIPEQRSDALQYYFEAIQTLKKVNTWEVKPVIEKLNMLYMYPGRKLHNKSIKELHLIYEKLQEARIDKTLQSKLAETEQPISINKYLLIGLLIYLVTLINR